MVENSLLFQAKEKFIDRKYRKQMEEWDKNKNLERGKRIAGAMEQAEKGHALKALVQSVSIGGEIREEIKAGDTSSFPYLLALAIIVDVVDFIPVLGTIVHVVAWPILFWGTFMRGRFSYKTKIRVAFFILSFLDIIPVFSWLPLETMSIIMLWRATAKTRREKEAEEIENDQKVVSLTERLKNVDQKYGSLKKRWGAAKKASQSNKQNQTGQINPEPAYDRAA